MPQDYLTPLPGKVVDPRLPEMLQREAAKSSLQDPVSQGLAQFGPSIAGGGPLAMRALYALGAVGPSKDYSVGDGASGTPNFSVVPSFIKGARAKAVEKAILAEKSASPRDLLNNVINKRDTLYHGTAPQRATDIVNTGELRPSRGYDLSKQYSAPPDVLEKLKNKSISLTREPAEAYQHGNTVFEIPSKAVGKTYPVAEPLYPKSGPDFESEQRAIKSVPLGNPNILHVTPDKTTGVQALKRMDLPKALAAKAESVSQSELKTRRAKMAEAVYNILVNSKNNPVPPIPLP